MEAIGVHRRASGETILTLMSDDNFSPLQRTLIMQFTLPEAKSAAATAAELAVESCPASSLASTISIAASKKQMDDPGTSPAMTVHIWKMSGYWEAEACASWRLTISRFSRRAFNDSSSSPALSR